MTKQGPPWAAIGVVIAVLILPALLVGGFAAIAWWMLDRGNLAGFVPLFLAWLVVLALKGKP